MLLCFYLNSIFTNLENVFTLFTINSTLYEEIFTESATSYIFEILVSLFIPSKKISLFFISSICAIGTNISNLPFDKSFDS